ncbi:MAG: hypothetical protein IT539_13690 [Bradyrhizobiaceae bacterium]|nr:hypothetical protein [Bradyrhizobiaceae bacterium]
MRQFCERAPQKQRRRHKWVAAAACALLLAGCAGQGILPETPLPPEPPGPAPAYPSFNAPDTGDDEARRVLTNIEQQELEAQLSKLAKDRESTVKRRIERAK